MTPADIKYVSKQVDRWIAMGDVIPSHRAICLEQTMLGAALAVLSGISVEEWCRRFHRQLKLQEHMDPREFKRRVRVIDRVKKAIR